MFLTPTERSFLCSIIENSTFHGSIVEEVAACKTALNQDGAMTKKDCDTAYRCLMASNVPASLAQLVSGIIEKFEGKMIRRHIPESVDQNYSQTAEEIMCGVSP